MIFDDKRSKESSVCVISEHRYGTILLLQLQLRERQPPVRHRPFSHKNSDEVFNVKSRESNIATGQMDIRTYNFKVMQMKAGHKTTVQCGQPWNLTITCTHTKKDVSVIYSPLAKKRKPAQQQFQLLEPFSIPEMSNIKIEYM